MYIFTILVTGNIRKELNTSDAHVKIERLISPTLISCRITTNLPF